MSRPSAKDGKVVEPIRKYLVDNSQYLPRPSINLTSDITLRYDLRYSPLNLFSNSNTLEPSNSVQRTKSWHLNRSRSIGASETRYLVSNTVSLYNRKVKDMKGRRNNKPSPPLYLGTELEDFAIHYISNRLDSKHYWSSGSIQCTDGRYCLSASPDGFVLRKPPEENTDSELKLIEIKCPMCKNHNDYIQAYDYQMEQQLLCVQEADAVELYTFTFRMCGMWELGTMNYNWHRHREFDGEKRKSYKVIGACYIEIDNKLGLDLGKLRRSKAGKCYDLLCKAMYAPQGTRSRKVICFPENGNCNVRRIFKDSSVLCFNLYGLSVREYKSNKQKRQNILTAYDSMRENNLINDLFDDAEQAVHDCFESKKDE